ncbi:DUF3291 domain-containing protein [Photobacterium sp. CAU 1568]|uniref:DUF3291 domain-containing protein n=1 Tax=Photobacterium arenosum TaxID=2774143 RepID=A0ABR9BN97_9GAMM|nr:DUF3291 domain-containing protein [Photobacterium arenosum]MBD8514048.1 DUF3291 domain-containing protein [Photobacterium arenosum]
MNKNKYHLAQFSISLARYSFSDEKMQGFVSRLTEINELADKSQGFIWRLKSDDGNSTSFRGYSDPNIYLNLSVWDSIENLREFVFKSNHVELFRKGKTWFHNLNGPITALWWIKEGEIPTIEDGISRLESIKNLGPTSWAFNFKTNYSPEAIESNNILTKCKKEVDDLHDFLQQWFQGEISNTSENRELLSSRFDQFGELLSPDGLIEPFHCLENRFNSAHGKFLNAKIWITGFTPVLLNNKDILVKYTEWRQIDGETNVRFTTALLSEKNKAPNGIVWKHIHETWSDVNNLKSPAPYATPESPSLEEA